MLSSFFEPRLVDAPCRAQPGPVSGLKVTFSSSWSGHRGKRRDFPSRLPPWRAACPQMLRVAAPASAPDAKQLIFIWLLQAASLHQPTVLMGKFPNWPLPEKRPEQELDQGSGQSQALLPPLLGSPGEGEKHQNEGCSTYQQVGGGAGAEHHSHLWDSQGWAVTLSIQQTFPRRNFLAGSPLSSGKFL